MGCGICIISMPLRSRRNRSVARAMQLTTTNPLSSRVGEWLTFGFCLIHGQINSEEHMTITHIVVQSR